MKKDDIKMMVEGAAAQLVKKEVTAWESAIVWVTDKVGFNMREVIKKCRKNFFGVFEQPIDPLTGQEMNWSHVTKEFVRVVKKNADLDAKDVNLRAKIASATAKAKLIKGMVINYLDYTFFGEDLDELIRDLAIDGTKVWKMVEVYDEELKRKLPKRVPVDLLNCYIDPNARSIQETPSFIERSVMTLDEFNSYADWINRGGVSGRLDIHPIDSDLKSTGGDMEMVEVFERWGLMPKYLLTGKEKDKKEHIHGRIVVSKNDDSYIVHLIEENKNKLKPYEEAWLERVPGRWYGEGVAEVLFHIQKSTNETKNIRRNRARVGQLGIWLLRKGSGVTPQMLSRMVANGAIPVTQMDDIQQLQQQDIPVSSYKDEEVDRDEAQRITSSYEAATGESLPSSMPATNAAIQRSAVQTSFVLIKEGVGFFLERYFKRHVIPSLIRNMKKGDVLRITGDINEIRALDDTFINNLLIEQLEEVKETGGFVDPMQIQNEVSVAFEKLMQMGEDRFVELLEKFDPMVYDVQFFVTNEKFDKAVVANDYLTAMQIIPERKNELVEAFFDLVGIPLKPIPPQMAVAPIVGQPQASETPEQTIESPIQSPQQVIQEALTQ